MEDRCVMLSNRYIAEMCPREWQNKENIVYCDYLEHLFLHVLICRYPRSEMPVGIGGVYIIANELNDLYSGFRTNQAWRKRCHAMVIDDKDVYFRILDKFFDAALESSEFDIGKLCHSFNQDFGLWNDGKNVEIYSEIKSMLEDSYAEDY